MGDKGKKDKVKKDKIHTYKKGSYPEKARKMIEQDDREWHLKVK